MNNPRWGGRVELIVNNDQIESNATLGAAGITWQFESLVHNNLIGVPWFNCYSFGNGVESNRIRDDFNQTTIDKGVKASTTLATQYKQERRKHGFIFSGIYNSNSGVNDTNQFIQALPITKDLNPEYGSIQKLFGRNTDILTFCEDKVLKVLSNKDALYNADGSSNVTASKGVLGATTPLPGGFGISRNPESFAKDVSRCYFSDNQRGTICMLEGDGIRNIGEIGMKDWFGDKISDLGLQNDIIGSYDQKKNAYNVTLDAYDKNFLDYDWETLTYTDQTQGWTSFKSFKQETGISLNNKYFTFKEGNLWQEHSNNTRNNFYGNQYDSSVEILFNDIPSSVKSFQTMSYEGTQSKIDQFTTVNVGGVNYTDKEYYNLLAKDGWYVHNMNTDLQSGKTSNFKNKEGKWFSVIKGENLDALLNDPMDVSGLDGTFLLDTNEFSTQGLGYANITEHHGHDDRVDGKVTFLGSDEASDGTSWD
jgi:hypothetical protein